MTFQDGLSKQAFVKAKNIIPGGVNSPVRALRSVGRDPIFIQSGKGSYIWDIDGNRYLDYVGSWGPLIVGHAHPAVVEAIQKTAERGTGFGAPTELETELAQEVLYAYPAMEMVRMVNSGTEATMSALRLARGITGRDKIVKFEGCYHGHSDSLLIKAGSGALTLGIPTSPGVSTATASATIVAQFNDFSALEEIFTRDGQDIAAVILEPVAGNMGVVLPEPGFLQKVRELTKRHGSILIFDEVMTGFRVSYGGAQVKFEIEPDLTCLGKIIGGGLPVGAYGGKREIMEQIAPSGPIYQAGTLSGNPLAMAAGLSTLQLLQQPGTYEELERKTTSLAQGLQSIAQELDLPTWVNSIGAMFSTFFTNQQVKDFQSASSSNVELFAKFFQGMLERGIYLAPSQFESVFLSTEHSNDDIEYTLEQARLVLKSIS